MTAARNGDMGHAGILGDLHLRAVGLCVSGDMV